MLYGGYMKRLKLIKSAFTLAEVFHTAGKYRRFAFTLAEVLITLGIIGVVAVLTIPTLVAKHKEKVTVVKVKKAYSILYNAFQFALANEGTVDNWGITGVYKDNDGNTQISQDGSEKMANIFMKYLNKSSFCGGKMDCIGGYDQIVLNGDEYTVKAQGASTVVLADGTGVAFTPWMVNGTCNSGCGSLTIYLEPNKKAHYGVNAFTFTLYKDKIIPWGSASIVKLESHNSFEKKCVYKGGNFENGLACTGWILEIGNMDYMHCDGLSFEGKHKCN